MRLDKALSKKISLLSRTNQCQRAEGELCPWLQKQSSMYLDSADVVRDVETSPLPLLTRVCLLAMRVELRLQRPLILFAVRAVSCTFSSEGNAIASRVKALHRLAITK
jgi:hypothetical protein